MGSSSFVGEQDAVYWRRPRGANASAIVDQNVPDRYEVTAGDESASMGAASVLDGCPFQEEKKGNACLLIIDPQIDFHEGGSLGVPGATKDSERIAALLLKHANKIDRVVRPLTARTALDVARLEARTPLLSSVARRSLARWSRWTRTTRCTLRTATFGRVPTASRPTRSQ